MGASKLLGIVRESLMAWAFGTSAIVDAFRVAQSGIFLIIHVFAGSVMESAFQPTFKHHLAAGRPRVAWRTAWLTGRSLAAIGSVLAIALLVLPGVATRALAPGFDAERTRLTTAFFRVMAVALPFGMLVSFLISLSGGLYRFRVPALRAVVQNLAVLGGIVAAIATGSNLLLGVSIPLSQVVMCALLLIALRHVGRRAPRGSTRRDRIAWRYFGFVLAPGLALVLLEQANLVVERIVGSRLPEGSIASLDYARFLVETPVVTIGLGITQTLLPRLADFDASGERERFLQTTRTLVLACLWALLPVSVWLLGFGDDLVRVLYRRGAFDEESVRTTSSALSGFAIGLWAWFGATLLQRAFYARRRAGLLLPLTGGSLVVFGLFAWHASQRIGVGGVSLAFAVSQILFFLGCLFVLGWSIARSILPVLAYMLAGAAILWALGPGIVPPMPALPHLLVGAALIGLAWMGWTAMHPGTRRLALATVRRVRGGGAGEGGTGGSGAGEGGTGGGGAGGGGVGGGDDS
ncbi:MAG: lipid II flippase MurJ [Candidatus Eisenbacteria bacterium]